MAIHECCFILFPAESLRRERVIFNGKESPKFVVARDAESFIGVVHDPMLLTMYLISFGVVRPTFYSAAFGWCVHLTLRSQKA